MQHDWRWISRWRWLRCQLPTRASRLAGKFAAGGAAVISSSARGAGGTREHVKEKQREVSRDSLGSAVSDGALWPWKLSQNRQRRAEWRLGSIALGCEVARLKGNPWMCSSMGGASL